MHSLCSQANTVSTIIAEVGAVVVPKCKDGEVANVLVVVLGLYHLRDTFLKLFGPIDPTLCATDGHGKVAHLCFRSKILLLGTMATMCISLLLDDLGIQSKGGQSRVGT